MATRDTIPELAGLTDVEAQTRIAAAINVLVDEPIVQSRTDDQHITDRLLARVYSQVGSSKDDMSADTRARALEYLRTQLVRYARSKRTHELRRTLQQISSAGTSSWSLHYARRSRRRILTVLAISVTCLGALFVIGAIAFTRVGIRASQLTAEVARIEAEKTARAAESATKQSKSAARAEAQAAEAAAVAAMEQEAAGVVITQPAIGARVDRRFQIAGRAVGRRNFRIRVSIYGNGATTGHEALISRAVRLGSDGKWRTTMDLSSFTAGDRGTELGSEVTVIAEMVRQSQPIATASRVITIRR